MEDYTAKDIVVLEGLKAVRKRPAMYIGSTDSRGLHQLVYEVIDNSIDEAMAGYCNNIYVEVKGNQVTVEDDGRGIPVDPHPKYNKPALEIVLTELHSGAKFEKKAYKVSGGLHGVGVHVVNALSASFEVFVKRDGFIYYQKYSKGEKQTDVKVIGKIENGNITWFGEERCEFKFSSPTGTLQRFIPDSEIMETTDFSKDVLTKRIEELSYLNRGLRIIFNWNGQEKEFLHEGGIKEMVQDKNKGKNVLHEDIIYNFSEKEGIQIEFALQYNDGVEEDLSSFANNINTKEGGTHVTGFKMALTKALNDAAKELKIIDSDDFFTGEDVREGLTAVIHVKLMEPQFEGQTKEKLGNSNVKGIVFSVVADYLSKYFEDYPKVAEAIARKAYQAALAREAARNARELVRSKSSLTTTLPGKLADCTLEDPEKTELYIVEGDSAAGSSKQGRDRTFQAILPLRGKILNVEKARWDKLVKNKEIKSLFAAINMSPNDKYDPKKLRYHKIIIMTDADVDGSHIRTLLLTLFYRYLRDLIVNGHIYIAQVPLYRIQKGSDIWYVYSDQEKDEIVSKLNNPIVQRFKGLGEMNPQQLWDTAMNPQTRRLLRVTIEDAEQADYLFRLLMGEDVEPRKEFIMSHAKEAQNIDV